MQYSSKQMEEQAVMQTAARMCAAARTAPKTKGIDNVLTHVWTGKEKDALADHMEAVALREFGGPDRHFSRDAHNLRQAQAVVLIGVRHTYYGQPHCSYCGFASCADCKTAGGRCAFSAIDLGIALSSAVAVAMDDRVDNRMMFSAGKALEEMDLVEERSILWHAIPLSVSGKNVFFDRKWPQPTK